ncbi:hypothetical protein DFH06DRAFT_757098 [Mycena polygramma]|nr:hypothetical protein DFH06DRAFT_757098 [Mycena polygramma]
MEPRQVALSSDASQVSLSSNAFTAVEGEVLIETAATSFLSSSSQARGLARDSVGCREQIYKSTPQMNTRCCRGQTSVRLVGRGGQGSRPPLPSNAGSIPPVPIRGVAGLEIRLSKRSVSTRIVGRGGIGSRPRELSAPAHMGLHPQSFPPATSLKKAAPQALYRPSGRGGVGSKPPAPKSLSHANEREKSFKILWKRERKKTGNASTYGAPSLTRTNTTSTMASLGAVEFLSTRGAQRLYQSTAVQDPDPVPKHVDSATRPTRRLPKFLRTLGAEGLSPGRGGISRFAETCSAGPIPDASGADKTLSQLASHEPMSSPHSTTHTAGPSEADDTKFESLSYDESADEHSELHIVMFRARLKAQSRQSRAAAFQSRAGPWTGL